MIRPNCLGVVMLSKVFSGAMLATALSASIVGAQSIAQLGGPANLPPSGFTGQQFVDSRGCVFLKAGFGNGTNWVPRVDRTHKPLCGFPPSFGAQVAAAVQADMAPEPGALAATPLVAAVAPQPSPQPAPTVVAVASAQPKAAAPLRSRMAAPSSSPGPTVYASAQPVAPAAPAPRGGGFLGFLLGTGHAASVPYAPPAPQVAHTPAPAATTPLRLVSNAIPTPPKGYKLAWKDDRLNPLRGIGTPAGQAAQDQIWTRDVPAVLVAVTAPAAPRLTTSVSTMSAPHTRATTGGAFVQVGSFGLPANATGASARLVALGLPVSTAHLTRGGKLLQVVYAGPFASAAAAQSALAAARNAGFSDAILK